MTSTDVQTKIDNHEKQKAQDTVDEFPWWFSSECSVENSYSILNEFKIPPTF